MMVYVAGRTNDIERIRRVQKALVDQGHIITYDWTQNVAAQRAEETSPPETLALYAANDCKGVVEADFIVVMCAPDLLGTAIEIGIAIHAGIPIFLVGEPERDSVFFYLPHFTRVENEEAFLELVANGAGR